MSRSPVVPFVDRKIAQRLERAEGDACARFAEARRQLFPKSGAEWISEGGAYVVFDGVDSPVTQTFGLGLLDTLTAATLDRIERFFHDRGAPVMHEVSPFAGIPALDLLCQRGYRPIEVSSVLFQPLANLAARESDSADIRVRVTTADEAPLWTDVNTRGWAHDHPEYRAFLADVGTVSAARHDSLCVLAEFRGQPGAAGILHIHDGVALLGGASTVPELRRRGLQSALLAARLRLAFERGCDAAMMVAQVGSESQRNAERRGFRVAYTRTKWQLRP